MKQVFINQPIYFLYTFLIHITDIFKELCSENAIDLVLESNSSLYMSLKDTKITWTPVESLATLCDFSLRMLKISSYW